MKAQPAPSPSLQTIVTPNSLRRIAAPLVFAMLFGCRQDPTLLVGSEDESVDGGGQVSPKGIGGVGAVGGQGAIATGGTTAPAQVTQVVQVAAGDYHTCALMADSTVRCWGFNYGGQVGDGNSGNLVLAPTPVTGLSGAIYIDADYTDSCAQLADSTVLCWGSNNYGQLGDGTTDERHTPVSVLGGKAVRQVSLGEYHSCALLQDGTVSWYGLGAESSDAGVAKAYRTPLSVPGLTNVTQISAGAVINCALLGDTTVSCWGGQSATTDLPLVASPVAGLSQVTKVAVAVATGCALLQDQTVKCWGRNTYGTLGDGTLGDGTTVDHDTPTPVAGLSGVVDLVPGENHFCALLAAGNVMCWGLNEQGQLGDGSRTTRPAPVAVAGLAGVKQVSAGGTHTCALLTTGAVMCWGDELAYVAANLPSVSPYVNRLTPAPIVF